MISAVKIIILLGLLVIIHECGHFFVARLLKVKAKEFAIGFGPKVWQKFGKETKYTLRLIPLGGYVNLEGEDARSDSPNSFSKARAWKKFLIVGAGAFVNIVFGLLIYYVLATILNKSFYYGMISLVNFIQELSISVASLFTGNIDFNQMAGPVGISSVVATAPRNS
jgi:regulator of sigma E protease